MGGNLLQNLGTPLAPTDSAPKGYVDSAASGLAPKLAVQAATAIALPGNTYSNGSSGVGATLTGNAVGELIVDSHPVALNDRILVQNEVNEINNGPYTCTMAGASGAAYVLREPRTRTLEQTYSTAPMKRNTVLSMAVNRSI
jgi:hypothetical protein